jgi:hypothetical protein
MFMPKQPISLTLDESNLVWLRGVTARSGARSVSETVDRIITAARESGEAQPQSMRSVVGTIDIAEGDEMLEAADAVVRAMFERSLARPFLVKEQKATYGAKRRSRRG